ncbi:MAG: thiamine phosphate synthase [Myxococcota bacterium]
MVSPTNIPMDTPPEIRARISGFYAILDRDDEGLARDLLRPVPDGGCGARVLQVRLKPTPQSDRGAETTTAQLVAVARMARALCAEYGALCIVNDRLDVALAVDADGVHLGQQDLSLADARAILGQLSPSRPFVVGITTNDRRDVERACRGGADYLGFGPVFPTTTKVNPDPTRGLEGLRDAVAAAGDVPVVAIGGITPERVAEVAAAGAAAACCVSAVNHASDRIGAGAAIVAAFERA